MAPWTAASPAAWGAPPLEMTTGGVEVEPGLDAVPADEVAAWLAAAAAAAAAALPPPTVLATCEACEAWVAAALAAAGVVALAAASAAAAAWAAACWAISWARVPWTWAKVASDWLAASGGGLAGRALGGQLGRLVLLLGQQFGLGRGQLVGGGLHPGHVGGHVAGADLLVERPGLGLTVGGGEQGRHRGGRRVADVGADGIGPELGPLGGQLGFGRTDGGRHGLEGGLGGGRDPPPPGCTARRPGRVTACSCEIWVSTVATCASAELIWLEPAAPVGSPIEEDVGRSVGGGRTHGSGHRSDGQPEGAQEAGHRCGQGHALPARRRHAARRLGQFRIPTLGSR